MSRPLARVAGILTALVATVGLAACGSDSSAAGGAPASVRVGYFPNVTHATGIVADKEGFFAKHLGATKLEVKTFNAGPAAMEALKSGAIDATYVGPARPPTPTSTPAARRSPSWRGRRPGARPSWSTPRSGPPPTSRARR